MTTLLIPLALLFVASLIVGLSNGFRVIDEGLALLEERGEAEPLDLSLRAAGLDGAKTARSSASPDFFDWQAEGWFPLHRETA